MLCLCREATNASVHEVETSRRELNGTMNRTDGRYDAWSSAVGGNDCCECWPETLAGEAS